MESMSGVSVLATEPGPSQLIRVQKQELCVKTFLKCAADLLPAAHEASHAAVNGNDLC